MKKAIHHKTNQETRRTFCEDVEVLIPACCKFLSDCLTGYVRYLDENNRKESIGNQTFSHYLHGKFKQFTATVDELSAIKTSSSAQDSGG